MNCLKKTIVLSSKEDGYRALCVLTLLKSQMGVFGAIRAYDIGSKSLILGISVNNKQVLKQNVEIENGKTYNFKLDKSFAIDGKIGCVLVENIDGKLKPIVYGASDDIKDYKQVVVETLNNSINNLFAVKEKAVLEEKNAPNFEEVIKDEEIIEERLKEEFDKESERLGEKIEEVEDIVSKNLTFEDDSSMQEIEEKEIEPKIIESAKLFEYDENVVEEEIKQEINRTNEFYNMISEQIDELFIRYPREERLEKLIPESKWVKVDYENEGRVYVIGLIYEDSVLQYVCYGVPGEYSIEPPRELEKYSQWLPLDPNEPMKDGYWIMYQDADSGDAVELNIT